MTLIGVGMSPEGTAHISLYIPDHLLMALPRLLPVAELMQQT
jgi:hypothetical protein